MADDNDRSTTIMATSSIRIANSKYFQSFISRKPYLLFCL